MLRITFLAAAAILTLSTAALAGATKATSRLLAFTSVEQGLQVFSVAPTGGDVRRVSSSSAVEYDGALSPDRTMIAYVSGRAGHDDLYVASADGTGAKRLTNDLAFEEDPYLSPIPSGSSLRATAMTVTATSSSSTPTAPRSRRCAGSTDDVRPPAWSPDGSRIAFDSDRDGDREIFVMATDGTGVTQLTATRSADDDRLPGVVAGRHEDRLLIRSRLTER